MIKTGLVSVTFRPLSVLEITELAVKSGLAAIEWGGDIHVPAGNIGKAREARKITTESGLITAAYGSYYKTGVDGDFEKVLESALELGSPSIRIWAGDRGSLEADEAWWSKVVEDTRSIAVLSRKLGIRISFEYHNGTLTDSPESAVKLITDVNEDNVFLYWQPEMGKDAIDNLKGLEAVSPWLSNVHVFHWMNKEQYPLEQGRESWSQYATVIAAVPGDRYAMLEFVKGGEPLQFEQDAMELNRIMKEAQRD